MADLNETAPSDGAYRAFKAACPGCGAPVQFRCASSTHAVCEYCSSTIVREGDALKRIGKVAELFDDHSPLQLGATGVFEGKAFTVVGRLQYAWQEGSWSEWHCYFDGEPDPTHATAWLSEDNGQYVFVREVPLARSPEVSALRVGATTALQGKRFQISAITRAHLQSAQGELPKLPSLSAEFVVVELRSDDGTILSLDYGAAGGGAKAYLGHSVRLSGLQMQGLREDVSKSEKGARQFSCPHCGAPVQLKLDSSKSISCLSCSSVIDVSQGPGQEVLAALQTEPVRPTISLGTIGTLFSVKWQVVGFQHRIGQVPGEDESFGWDEYLLYEPKEGFAFLVDSSEGWSFVRPLSGAPDFRPGTRSAKYLGKTYTLKYEYNAEVTYVLGEFYWRITRGAKTFNSDFGKDEAVLSREQSVSEGAEEITWSLGKTVDASLVNSAFGLKSAQSGIAEDISPLGSQGISVKTLIILFFVFLLIAGLMSMCSSAGSGKGSSLQAREKKCEEDREMAMQLQPTLEQQQDINSKYARCMSNARTTYRSSSSGGSYGGSWGGGGHK